MSGESAMVAWSKSGAEEGASGQVQSGEASEEDHGSLYNICGSRAVDDGGGMLSPGWSLTTLDFVDVGWWCTDTNGFLGRSQGP